MSHRLRIQRLAHAADLPLPRTNKVAGGRRVDCRWPAHRLTVELDGFRFHNSRYAWRQGLKREREARARGDEFRRYDYEDVFEHPSRVPLERIPQPTSAWADRADAVAGPAPARLELRREGDLLV